jgi:hypothetical protein
MMREVIRQILRGVVLDFWLKGATREVYWFKKSEYCPDRCTGGRTVRITIEYVDEEANLPIHTEKVVVVPEVEWSRN